MISDIFIISKPCQLHRYSVAEPGHLQGVGTLTPLPSPSPSLFQNPGLSNKTKRLKIKKKIIMIITTVIVRNNNITLLI